MLKEIKFNKYQKRGAYHWQQIAKNIFTFNAYVSIRYQQVVNQIPRQKSLKILDIGCGDGVLAYLISQKIRADITGIDIDFSAIKFARQQFKNQNIKARFLKSSAYKLPFKKQFFDVVIATEIIEHLGKPEIMLKEIKRVLKPKGKIIITTPIKLSDILEDKMHIKEFTPKELSQALTKYFTNITIKTSHPFWLKKIYLFGLVKLGQYHFEPFRWLINLWIILTKLNPFLLSSKNDTSQMAVCFKF